RNGGDVDIGYVFCQGCHLVLWLQLCWQLEEFFANVLQVVFDELASFRLHCGVVPAALTEVRGYWFWVAPDLQTVAADADSLSADVCGVFGGVEVNEASHMCCGAEAQFLAEKFWHWLTGFIVLDVGRGVWDGFCHGGGCNRDDWFDGKAGALDFLRPCVDHATDAGCCCCIVGLSEVSTLTGWRTDGHDAAFDFVVFEVVKGCSDTGEGTAQVDVDNLIKIIVRHL